MRSASLWAVGTSLLMALLPVAAMADGASVDVATADQKASAQQHFEAAIKAFGKDNFDAALGEFTASYGVVASPNAHYMMAKCLAQLGKSAEAYNALGSLDGEARGLDKYAETLKNGADLRAELTKKVGVVVVSVSGAPPGGATVTVGGTPATLDVPFAVMPGHVDVAVLVNGKAAKTESVTIAAGENHAVKVKLDAPVTSDKPNPILPTKPVDPDAGSSPVASSARGRTGFYVGAGILGAVAVGGIAVGIPFGLMFNNDKSYFQDSANCPNKKCKLTTAQFNDKQSKLNRDGTVATVGFVVGGIAAAGAITLAVVGATRPKASQRDQSSLEVDVGPGSIGLTGSF